MCFIESRVRSHMNWGLGEIRPLSLSSLTPACGWSTLLVMMGRKSFSVECWRKPSPSGEWFIFYLRFLLASWHLGKGSSESWKHWLGLLGLKEGVTLWGTAFPISGETSHKLAKPGAEYNEGVGTESPVLGRLLHKTFPCVWSRKLDYLYSYPISVLHLAVTLGMAAGPGGKALDLCGRPRFLSLVWPPRKLTLTG